MQSGHHNICTWMENNQVYLSSSRFLRCVFHILIQDHVKGIKYLVSCLITSISTLTLAVTLCLENHTLAGPAPRILVVFVYIN